MSIADKDIRDMLAATGTPVGAQAAGPDYSGMGQQAGVFRGTVEHVTDKPYGETVVVGTVKPDGTYTNARGWTPDLGIYSERSEDGVYTLREAELRADYQLDAQVASQQAEIDRQKASGLLAQRQQTHGNFETTAAYATQLKDVIFEGPDNLEPDQREALDMICSKIARIMSGNPNEPDHWRDIAGYATLVADRLA